MEIAYWLATAQGTRRCYDCAWVNADRMRTIDPTIGKRLAAIRQHRRLSQAELAAMVGASKSAIYHYEHGNARIWPSLLSALASALRCRISDLHAQLDAPLPEVKFGGASGGRRWRMIASHPSVGKRVAG
jgi:DNA-binding XRE family transcriptional regulator